MYRTLCHYFSLGMLFIAAASVAFSTAGLEIGSYLALLGFLLGGDYRGKWKIIQDQSWIVAALVLFLIVLACSIYTIAPWNVAVKTFSAYEKLLILPVAFYLLSQYPRARLPFLSMLIASVLANFCLGILRVHQLFLSPSSTYSDVEISHIALSYFASVLAFFFGFLLLFRYRDLKISSRIGLGLGCLFCLDYLLMNTIGRSGLVTLVVLVFFGFYQGISQFKAYKVSILALLAVIALVLAAHHFSPTLNKGLDRGTHDIQEYQEGDANTSWGIRLNFWKTTFHLVEQSPVIGYGSGSTSLEYQAYRKAHPDPNAAPMTNPHDQYLFLALEQGVVGLLTFIIFLSLLYKTDLPLLHISPKLRQYDTLLKASVLAFAVGCLFNSWLHDVHEGYFSLLWMTTLKALLHDNESE